ncbi:MAG: hypothetical protein IJE10_00990 [Clostridia bacterium]|nr:hypothetical protein [Clostridia bacterium]
MMKKITLKKALPNKKLDNPTFNKNLDLFVDKQPPMAFVEELKKPLHAEKPKGFGLREKETGEIDVRGMYLDIRFPDEKGLLETAFDDFDTFLKVYEMGGTRYPVRIEMGKTSCFEEHIVTVSESECVICSADTEGVRRALVHLEDLITESEAPFLKPFTETRKPAVKSRITRGFFSPTNREPNRVDELFNDVDYYPDNYLNRIAHDGNNGIWIYTYFSDLLTSDIITEYGEGSEQRLEKLRKVVEKCARYGIKVYVFGVEPSGLPEDLAGKYPEINGAPGWNRPAFCTHTEEGAKYCIEMTERLFRAVPDLGGFIDITEGERVTNCASVVDYSKCPRCGQYKMGDVLSHTVDLIKEGMRRAGAKGEFISWTYGHRMWEIEDVKDYVKSAPKDVALMQNFDDYGFPEQLGKNRLAFDYWLSYAGPSYLFEETAKCANENGKQLYAKMQVCCSHEVASVPYVPVPSLLFEKYKGARQYNVEGILQCWYFGNYPSMMSKAAGELSFMWDFSDADAFLKHLAGILYGRSHAEDVAKAWKLFSAAYENYPVNTMFSYYGPMHDGVTWELQLLPKNHAMPRSWFVIDRPYGDRVSDCLTQGHDLWEAVELLHRMNEGWKEGLSKLPEGVSAELESVAKALGILFDSGYNIMRFYELREKLGLEQGDAKEILEEMKQIVYAEMENSKRMIPLCENDNRLGYHSEAQGFKFFPEKIEFRIESLKTLLETEFCEVEARINQGKAPLGYYKAEGKDCYPLGTDLDTAKAEKIGEIGTVKVAYDADRVYLDVTCPKDAEVIFAFEGRLMWPCSEMYIRDGKPFMDVNTGMFKSFFGDRFEKEYEKYEVKATDTGYFISADRKQIGWTDDEKSFRAFVSVNKVRWQTEENPIVTLGKFNWSAEEFRWIKKKI